MPSKKPVEPTPKTEDGTRLNKYLSNAGIASRRKADELIKEGRVTVNGKVVTEMGHKVKRDDLVKFNGQAVVGGKKVYILLNKPKNTITTTDDEKGRKTVLQIIQKATEERVYPVGRLDRNTTGLLLLTNDGELTQKLSHPSYEVKKTYLAVLNNPLPEEVMTEIRKGITLEDGPVKVDKIAYANAMDPRDIGVELHSGKNRVVRRIFEHFGFTVEKLDRVYYAGLTKKNLPRGKWRFLTPKEVLMLKHFT